MIKQTQIFYKFHKFDVRDDSLLPAWRIFNELCSTTQKCTVSTIYPDFLICTSKIIQNDDVMSRIYAIERFIEILEKLNGTRYGKYCYRRLPEYKNLLESEWIDASSVEYYDSIYFHLDADKDNKHINFFYNCFKFLLG